MLLLWNDTQNWSFSAGGLGTHFLINNYRKCHHRNLVCFGRQSIYFLGMDILKESKSSVMSENSRWNCFLLSHTQHNVRDAFYFSILVTKMSHNKTLYWCLGAYEDLFWTSVFKIVVSEFCGFYGVYCVISLRSCLGFPQALCPLHVVVWPISRYSKHTNIVNMSSRDSRWVICLPWIERERSVNICFLTLAYP